MSYPETSCPKAERKSALVNQEYKLRLNQLSEFIDRLERIRRDLFSISQEAPKLGVQDGKRPEPTSFLEIWQDHTDYFTSLLNQLERVVGELEQF